MPASIATQLAALARTELPTDDLHREPIHAQQYQALLPGSVDFGPVFTFPNPVTAPDGVVRITELAPLARHFRGWTADELPERQPIMAIQRDGGAASVCFCARSSPRAAEAGVETAPAYRQRGFAATVTAAWAHAIRASGRLPLYSTSWTNDGSLAVAAKLGLIDCASDWSLVRA